MNVPTITSFDNRTLVTDVARFTVFIFCFYFVCAVPLKLSGLHHVNLDIHNNNNQFIVLNNRKQATNDIIVDRSDTPVKLIFSGRHLIIKISSAY